MNPHLVQARRIVDGAATSTQPLRAACWLARAALEDALLGLLRDRGCDPGRASARSLLTCLQSLYGDDDPDLVLRAEYAWSGLSAASHLHAYELTPTLAEVCHLIDLVTALTRHPSVG